MFILVSAAILIYHKARFSRHGVPTEARIVDIRRKESRGRGESVVTTTTCVSYDVNGETYESELGFHSGKFQVGQILDAYYLDTDPHKIRLLDENKFLKQIIGFCLILAALGVVAFIAFRLLISKSFPV
ncbi:MAG: DUF3592 domain-containing protein [Clostridia bacterium]|nr:DUF3592 domain-containing protein [Clostridia bacterium]